MHASRLCLCALQHQRTQQWVVKPHALLQARHTRLLTKPDGRAHRGRAHKRPHTKSLMAGLGTQRQGTQEAAHQKPDGHQLLVHWEPAQAVLKTCAC